MTRQLIITALLGALLAIVATFAMVYQVNRRIPAPVASVDLNTLMTEATERLTQPIAGNLDAPVTDEQRAGAVAGITAFTTALDAVVKQISAECGCVLVNQAALLTLGNVRDYTAEVRDRVALAVPALGKGAAARGVVTPAAVAATVSPAVAPRAVTPLPGMPALTGVPAAAGASR